jgi:LPXTG-motif cell wall-anchored protein
VKKLPLIACLPLLFAGGVALANPHPPVHPEPTHPAEHPTHTATHEGGTPSHPTTTEHTMSTTTEGSTSVSTTHPTTQGTTTVVTATQTGTTVAPPITTGPPFTPPTITLPPLTPSPGTTKSESTQPQTTTSLPKSESVEDTKLPTLTSEPRSGLGSGTPEGDLPDTGFDLVKPLILGVFLLLAGALTWFTRRG